MSFCVGVSELSLDPAGSNLTSWMSRMFGFETRDGYAWMDYEGTYVCDDRIGEMSGVFVVVWRWKIVGGSSELWQG